MLSTPFHHGTRALRVALLSALAILLVAASSPCAHAALTFNVEATGWPDATRRQAAINALTTVTNRYNAYGDFGNYNIYAYYNSGIPTAQANYLGSIGYGGTYPNERVTQHESSHYLGTGTTSQYAALVSGGAFNGARATAIMKQFEGEQEYVHTDGTHYWPYGMNYDSEFSEINAQREVALLYEMRRDMGIGSMANPWSATTVALTGSDPFGESGFNYKVRWSDGYFAHAGAAYSTGAFLMRTPESTNSFTFAGDSLTLSNPAVDTGLYYKGLGTTGVVTFKNLILDGGWVDHRSTNNLADLFQLDGKVTVQSASNIRAYNGNINILADVAGAGTLTIQPSSNIAENNRYVRFASSANTFTGSIVNASRFELTSTGNFDFKIGASGVNNAISGASARNTLLNGSFDIDLTTASSAPGSSWALVTAANTTYGATFKVNGFDKSGTLWSNGAYKFNQATGLLTPVTAWATDGGGNWSGPANWTAGVPLAGDDALFGSALTAPNAPANVNLDAPVNLSRITFDNANRYVIGSPTPNTLTLSGVAQINTKTGSHEIAVPIAGSAGLTKTGPGTLTLSAPNTYTGNTNIEAGMLALAGAAAIPNTQRIDVKPGATLNVAALPSGFTLASGQTLNNDSDNTVAGNVVAATGSTVSGTGTFAGNLTAQAGATIRVGGAGLSALTPTLNQVAYVDATIGAGGNTTLPDGSVFNPKAQGTTGADNDWEQRTLGSSATTIESGGEAIENAYEIKTTISGLNPLESYRVHVLFWDPASTAEDWNIRAGFTSNAGANTLYSVADATAELGGATAAPAATTLNFRTAPTTLSEGGRTMLAANLGARTADSSGKIEIYIDDLPPSVAANRRTLYDGIGVTQLGAVTMNIAGDYTQSAGATIVMDVLSTSVHDELIIGGAFSAGGTLQLVQNPGAVPFVLGDALDLFDFATASGAFDAFNLPALTAGLLWNVSSLTSTGELQVVQDVDLDNDGYVTGNDFLLLQQTDPTLIATWRAQFGTQVVAGASAIPANATIPEPAAATLILFAACGLARLRRAT